MTINWSGILLILALIAAPPSPAAQVPSLSGRIIDAAGGPLPGVAVVATIDGRAQSQRTVTDIQGRYGLDLTPGQYRLEARLAGFAAAYLTVVVAPGRTTEWSPSLLLYKGIDPLAELRLHIELLTGPDPRDCGQHLLGRRPPVAREELLQSLDCVLDAKRQLSGVWTFKQEQGIDSWIAAGLVGTAAGNLFKFSFSGSPCGGPGCAARFTVERCLMPDVIADRFGRVTFDCRRGP